MRAMGWVSLVAPVFVSGSVAWGQEVAERAEDVQPLEVGAEAPRLTVRSAEGEAVALGEVYAQGPTLLIFYRGSWCPYCTRHLAEVAEVEAELRARGVHVVAVSPDRPEVLAQHVADHALPYTLLSDADVALATAFGLAFRVDDGTLERYRGYGIDLQAASGYDHHTLPVPAVVLIDRDGVIRFAHWNPDYRSRLSAEALLEATAELE